MTIVFGIRNFRLKSFSPAELGVTDPQFQYSRFELRQGYFHLFWIPFFSTGTFWAVEMAGHSREINRDFVKATPEQLKSWSRLWAFTGLLLIVGGLLIAWIVNAVAPVYYRYRAKKHDEARVEQIMTSIQNPQQQDYFVFVTEDHTDYYAQFVAKEGDSLVLNFPFYTATSDRSKWRSREFGIGEETYFLCPTNRIKTIHIAKGDLEMIADTDMEHRPDEFKSVPGLEFLPYDKLALRRVTHRTFPKEVYSQYPTPEMDTIRIHLEMINQIMDLRESKDLAESIKFSSNGSQKLIPWVRGDAYGNFWVTLGVNDNGDYIDHLNFMVYPSRDMLIKYFDPDSGDLVELDEWRQSKM